MLRELLRRDLLLHGRMLLVSYSLFLAFQVYLLLRMDSDRLWAVSATLYASFLAITVFAREDKFRSSSWTCTLPVTRSQIVRARFVGAWILVVGAMAAGTTLAAVLPGSLVAPAGILEPSALLLVAVVITLVLSMMLPFLIRFGLVGMLVFLVGAQVLGAGLLVFAIVTGGRGRNGIRFVFSAVRNGVLALHEALPAPLFYAVVIAALVAANWTGFRLAVFLFRRREL